MDLNKDNDYINWLKERSLLFSAKELAKEISGKSVQWQNPYAYPQGRLAVATAPVWFSAYPPATITANEQNILQLMGDKKLWSYFDQIGIKALHTGPMKLAGGIVGYEHTPTVDGWFDRIGLEIDPVFGSEIDYMQMVDEATAHQAVVSGDIVPGHTGKGFDFLLALRNYAEYPGIYTLVEIASDDWGLLPNVADEWQSINLDFGVVDKLAEKGYLPGRLQRVLFSDPGSKNQVSGWDATGEVKGLDGIKRRWVYLHYFKPGQPTMNWLDPAQAAQMIIAGDIIKSIYVLKNKILRLDANPFLGIEKGVKSATAWSEGHPLSVTSSNTIAWLVRKLSGWSFQELNLTLDAIKVFSEYGPDLSYDFISRPALQHAILTKDATFLRFMLDLMHHYEIDAGTLLHAMQNHDEITYELVHFLGHATDRFNYAGEVLSGKELRDKIISEMKSLAINNNTPYNRLSGNGLCTTFTGLIATRLKIKDLDAITTEQKDRIKQGHFLMALFNAMQPGVFCLSGWDLFGALPLQSIEKLTADGDFRWVNRGAYDLLNSNPEITCSADGVPKAPTLYAPLAEQLVDKNSFVFQLKNMLKMREQYKLHLAKQLDIPKVNNKGAVILLHELPDNVGIEITALNFSDEVIIEIVNLSEFAEFRTGTVVNILTGMNDGEIMDGKIAITLRSLEGKALVVGNASIITSGKDSRSNGEVA